MTMSAMVFSRPAAADALDGEGERCARAAERRDFPAHVALKVFEVLELGGVAGRLGGEGGDLVPRVGRVDLIAGLDRDGHGWGRALGRQDMQREVELVELEDVGGEPQLLRVG